MQNHFFNLFKNEIPPYDLEYNDFLKEFKTNCSFTQLEVLDPVHVIFDNITCFSTYGFLLDDSSSLYLLQISKIPIEAK